MLISANKLTEPILAIIDPGSYSDNEGTSDTGYEYFMEAAQNYVKIDWNRICKHKISNLDHTPSQDEINEHYKQCNADEDTHDMLALLVRQLGKESYVNYSDDGTSGGSDWVAVEYIMHVMNNYNYIEINESKFYDYIKDEGVVFVSGYTEDNKGHAWVIDGIYGIEYTITTYFNYCPSTGEYDSKTTYHEKAKYVHCNWGNRGNSNGYFLDGIYDTEKGINPPSGYGPNRIRSRYNFNKAIVGTVFK